MSGETRTLRLRCTLIPLTVLAVMVSLYLAAALSSGVGRNGVNLPLGLNLTPEIFLTGPAAFAEAFFALDRQRSSFSTWIVLIFVPSLRCSILAGSFSLLRATSKPAREEAASSSACPERFPT